MTTEATATREVVDEQGRVWLAVATEVMAAHLKQGARLSFRLAEAPEGETIPTPVVFNSMAAADFALRTLGDKELRRRLQWARTDAGIA